MSTTSTTGFDYDSWLARYTAITARFAENPGTELTFEDAQTVALRWMGDHMGDAPWENEDDGCGRPNLYAFADGFEAEMINPDTLLREAWTLRRGMPADLARYCGDHDISPETVIAWADALVRHMQIRVQETS